MRSYPDEIEIKGVIYRYEKILKDDFFSVNVLYRCESGRRFVLKLSDFRVIGGWVFRPIAMLMSGHEYKIYRMVDGLPGVPELGPRLGRRGYFHEFIEGRTLHQIDKDETLPEDFFDRLLDLTRQVHARRILYSDMNKRGNVILGDDGGPWLIDYQISLYFPKRPWWLLGGISDRIFRRLIREDIRHIYKHKKRWQRARMTDEELRAVNDRGFMAPLDRFLIRPYRKFKRLLYPKGSNETVFWKWRQEKDKSKRMP